MNFALSTHWNAARHTTGEAMIEEIVGLGFDRVELGYDTRIDLVPGVQKMVEQKVITVDSLHNYCPVPVGAPRGHPELFTLASTDARERQSAVQHTTRTIRFAAEIGARFIVTHAGHVDMAPISRELYDLCYLGQQFTPRYEKLKLKVQLQREKKVKRQLQYLDESIAQLLPVLEETRTVLAFENLPTWEAIPTEIELEELFKRMPTDRLAYWHDMGHGQIRQNVGFINHERWLERLQSRLAGMHIHDVAPPATDHVMPPLGHIEFSRFQRFAALDIVRVIEPSAKTPANEVEEALRYLRECWSAPAPSASTEANGKVTT